MAGRLDHREPLAISENQRGEVLLTEISHQLTSGGGKPGQGYPAILSPTLRVGPQRPQDGGPGDTGPIIAATLNSGGNDGGFRTEPGEHLVAYRKSARVNADPDSPESWVNDGLANTLNNFDIGDVRTTHAIVGGRSVTDNEMLPLGLDSHRYRCCGNGVVANVSYWLGVRIARVVQEVSERAA
jgi:DNA (cytosine-5)-methyltransferase 1